MAPPRLFGLRRAPSDQGSGVLDVPVDDRSENGASSARGGTPRGSTPRLTSRSSDGLRRRESSGGGGPGPVRGVMLDEVGS